MSPATGASIQRAARHSLTRISNAVPNAMKGRDAMTTIYKYPLSLQTTTELEMPVGAKILSIQMQGGLPTIWALVQEEARDETRTFLVFGTGGPLDDYVLTYPHIATVQDGSLVWHIFEKTTSKVTP